MLNEHNAATLISILMWCKRQGNSDAQQDDGGGYDKSQKQCKGQQHTLPWQCRLPLVVSGGGACRSSASAGVATDMLPDACGQGTPREMSGYG